MAESANRMVRLLSVWIQCIHRLEQGEGLSSAILTPQLPYQKSGLSKPLASAAPIC